MKTKDLCPPCTTALQCLEAEGCALSKEKEQRMPEFSSILRRIKDRGEDPYCGFEEVLCEIVKQLERELAAAQADAAQARKAANSWKDELTALQSASGAQWIEEELKDGDRICEAAGVQRTEGGRLPVAKIINAIRGRPVLPHRSGGPTVPAGEPPLPRYNDGGALDGTASGKGQG